jgi:hypothetical protein
VHVIVLGDIEILLGLLRPYTLEKFINDELNPDFYLAVAQVLVSLVSCRREKGVVGKLGRVWSLDVLRFSLLWPT